MQVPITTAYAINNYMDKSVYDTRENDLTYGRGYVYSIQYHIVWCTKYLRLSFGTASMMT